MLTAFGNALVGRVLFSARDALQFDCAIGREFCVCQEYSKQNNRLQPNPKLTYFEGLEVRSRVPIEEFEPSTRHRVAMHVPLQVALQLLPLWQQGPLARDRRITQQARVTI